MRFSNKDLTSYSFVYTFCVLLSIPPLIHLTTICWTKGIDTQMTVTHPVKSSLPSFTICTDFLNLIDFNLIKINTTMYSELNNFFNTKDMTENEWQGLLNQRVVEFFGTQMNLTGVLSYIKDVDKLMESISLYGVINLPEKDKSLTSEEIGEKYCRKTIAIKNNFLCIVITCLMNSQRPIISDKRISESHVRRGVVLRFKFLHSMLQDLNFVLLAAHDEPLINGYDDRLSEIKIRKQPHLYQFQIRTYKNILLPPPSPTNCKNYTILEDATIFRSRGLAICLFDKLTRLNMVYFPDSINISWIAENNYTILLNKRPQYNGMNFGGKRLENEAALKFYEECSEKFVQPDCIQSIYLVYHLEPICLDSTVFYDDGIFRFDKEFLHLLNQSTDSAFILNESELILHDQRKDLYSVFQLLQPSYPLMTNKCVEAMELKEYIVLAATIYGAFTTFCVCRMIKRLILWAYSAFLM